MPNVYTVPFLDGRLFYAVLEDQGAARRGCGGDVGHRLLEAAGLIVGSLELSEDGPGAGFRAKGAVLMFGAETTWPEAIIFLGVLLRRCS